MPTARSHCGCAVCSRLLVVVLRASRCDHVYSAPQRPYPWSCQACASTPARCPCLGQGHGCCPCLAPSGCDGGSAGWPMPQRHRAPLSVVRGRLATRAAAARELLQRRMKARATVRRRRARRVGSRGLPAARGADGRLAWRVLVRRGGRWLRPPPQRLLPHRPPQWPPQRSHPRCPRPRRELRRRVVLLLGLGWPPTRVKQQAAPAHQSARTSCRRPRHGHGVRSCDQVTGGVRCHRRRRELRR